MSSDPVQTPQDYTDCTVNCGQLIQIQVDSQDNMSSRFPNCCGSRRCKAYSCALQCLLQQSQERTHGKWSSLWRWRTCRDHKIGMIRGYLHVEGEQQCDNVQANEFISHMTHPFQSKMSLSDKANMSSDPSRMFRYHIECMPNSGWATHTLIDSQYNMNFRFPNCCVFRQCNCGIR